MFRRRREEFSFWPALADFVLAILLLIVILWVADAGMRAVLDLSSPRLKPGEIAVSVNEWNRRRIIPKGMEIVSTIDLEGFKHRIGELQEELNRRPDKPLVFDLEEASGFAFESGKADLPPEFKRKLREVIFPKIQAIVNEFKIDVMEAIGHTDGQPIRRRDVSDIHSRRHPSVIPSQSNLDYKLNGFIVTPNAERTVQSLRFDSNADLALARALAVTVFLQSEFVHSGDKKLTSLSCRGYSGAQIISPATNAIEGAFDKDQPTRRRIELRFTWNPKRGQ
jgi:outer membrane protein OmpA-like peptidoglycan-associated protein